MERDPGPGVNCTEETCETRLVLVSSQSRSATDLPAAASTTGPCPSTAPEAEIARPTR